MSWVEANDYAESAPDPIAPSADGIIRHMNADHVAAQIILVQHFLGHDAISVQMTAVDRLGCELDVTTATGTTPRRLAFPRAQTSGDDVHHTLIAMLNDARVAKGVAR